MSRAAFLCLLAGGCAIAFAPIFVRLSDTGPVASAFWRTALASPLLWIWLARERKPGTDPSFPPGGKLGSVPGFRSLASQIHSSGEASAVRQKALATGPVSERRTKIGAKAMAQPPASRHRKAARLMGACQREAS